MADIKSINFVENTSPPTTRNIFVGNEVDGEWERLTVDQFLDNFNLKSEPFTPDVDSGGFMNTPTNIEASTLRIRDHYIITVAFDFTMNVNEIPTLAIFNLPIGGSVQLDPIVGNRIGTYTLSQGSGMVESGYISAPAGQSGIFFNAETLSTGITYTVCATIQYDILQ